MISPLIRDRLLGRSRTGKEELLAAGASTKSQTILRSEIQRRSDLNGEIAAGKGLVELPLVQCTGPAQFALVEYFLFHKCKATGIPALGNLLRSGISPCWMLFENDKASV